MKDQDQQLDLIGQGVSNLRNYSLTVKDETELHVRLLNEIDDDVSRVTDGLESEGARAARVRYAALSCSARKRLLLLSSLTMTCLPLELTTLSRCGTAGGQAKQQHQAVHHHPGARAGPHLPAAGGRIALYPNADDKRGPFAL
ncbi:hypothetical protein ON010_g19027 [Phytophthora cinnamomi]|nr:hypothetical protein ON010_g19027 [Phytophthora cinnamomi]